MKRSIVSIIFLGCMNLFGGTIQIDIQPASEIKVTFHTNDAAKTQIQPILVTDQKLPTADPFFWRDRTRMKYSFASDSPLIIRAKHDTIDQDEADSEIVVTPDYPRIPDVNIRINKPRSGDPYISMELY